MNATKASERVRVTVGDAGIVDHAGAGLLGRLADEVGLGAALSARIAWTGERAPIHDRGRLLCQSAVMLADGGECLSDLSVLRNESALWGEMASDATVWRAFHEIDDSTLAGLETALAEVRERVWDRIDTGAGGVVIDVDSTLVEIHSENKEDAAPHFKRGYGFHPIIATCDTTGETLAATLRAGNAAANSAADQLGIVDAAIAQLPERVRRGHQDGDDAVEVTRPVVVRADSAGAVKAFVCGLRRRNIGFSVTGRYSDLANRAIRAIPSDSWEPALTQSGAVRRGAFVAEIDVTPDGWPSGTRAIVRRERAHPGAQMRLWDLDGFRFQVVLTDQCGDPVAVEAAHRAHAHVEDHVKTLKDVGLTRMPFTKAAANRVWTFCCLLAQNLLRWFQALALDPDDPLARAAPKTLRYRLLHVAGRLVRHARTITVRIEGTWPWADTFTTAWTRICALT